MNVNANNENIVNVPEPEPERKSNGPLWPGHHVGWSIALGVLTVGAIGIAPILLLPLVVYWYFYQQTVRPEWAEKIIKVFPIQVFLLLIIVTGMVMDDGSTTTYNPSSSSSSSSNSDYLPKSEVNRRFSELETAVKNRGNADQISSFELFEAGYKVSHDLTKCVNTTPVEVTSNNMDIMFEQMASALNLSCKSYRK